jgi:hypothetical protein
LDCYRKPIRFCEKQNKTKTHDVKTCILVSIKPGAKTHQWSNSIVEHSRQKKKERPWQAKKNCRKSSRM